MNQLYRDQPLPAQTNHDLQALLVVFNLPTKTSNYITNTPLIAKSFLPRPWRYPLESISF